MSKTAKILLGALAAIAVIACVALVAVWLINRGGNETPADSLTGTKWQVQSYYNAAEAGGMASPLASTQLTAEFADGAVAGSSGCNNYKGSYTLNGGSLSFGPLASTMMYCDGAMDQEVAFLAAMQSASSFKLETGQLHILNAQGQVVVDFIPYTQMSGATELPAAGATEAPPAADDSWDRIQAAGKIVVGTISPKALWIITT